MRLSTLIVCCLIMVLAAPGLARAFPATQSEPAQLHADALIPPPPPAALLGDLGYDPRGPSQYMAGDVAVRVVLPESDGSIDPSTEDWTPAQIAAVQAEIAEMLAWWQAQLPLARLRFQLRFEVVPTGYEPISHSMADEGLWIADVLGQLGFTQGSYFDRAYSAAYALRDELGADWATTIFVANSDQGDGYFADNSFAYAYINGPFLILTSDGGAYGADQLAVVAAHELGHIFGALDQYQAARVPCERSSGYLNIPTSNSQHGDCGTQLSSIMLEPLTAYAAGAVDPSALAQLGYRDSDADGAIDILDTAPALALEDAGLQGSSGRPLLRGSSQDLGFPSPLQPAVSINTIAAIEYRVAGGIWQPVGASDGAYDGPVEQFSAELALYDGDYSVELRAINSAGSASRPLSRHVIVSGVGPQPDYAVSAPASLTSPELRLSLSAPAATAAVQISEDPGFDGAAWQPYAPELSYQLSDGEGAKEVYVRFRDAAGLNSLAYPLQVELSQSFGVYLPFLVR